MRANELAELVKQKIENLRPKLLDLSRRNPLIATKLGPRSNSHIRVVDELPDILFYKLSNGQELPLVPLPAIDEDPRDEGTPAFREALINARLTDEQYLAEIESVDRDADDYIDRTRQIERALKDRVREALGLPPRTNKNEVNLVHHAKINGITPSYELPTPDAGHADGRHNDDNIQTLLLPNDLERKLNAIVSKCRTWVQETGMNVLHVAYGFLEWSDGFQSETSFAPLILCEAKIDKRRTSKGVEFSISGTGDEPETNAVLAEKLRLEFSVELPTFAGSSVEKYFSEVAELSPRNVTLRVRRQVAIGVFPSARMAMYHDLDPEQPGFPENEIVHSLLAGSNADSSSPFADEYEVDDPKIEAKVPCLVMDADSSQFSTLVDVAEGKNLAVEGPPGTGKSQTIVNAIAAALAEGKKILFVAEKLAALNVVKSRLEAAGLGEFLLPLQAERSTREQVIESVRERLEMKSGAAVRDYDTKLGEYRRIRQQIAKYIELMSRPFEESGLTIREILGKSIATNPKLASFPAEMLERCKVPKSFLTLSGLALLRQLGTRIVDAYRGAATAQANWNSTKLLNPERFTIEEACDLAKRASEAFSAVAGARDGLSDGHLPQAAAVELAEIDAHLEQAQRHVQDQGATLLLNLLREGNGRAAKAFIGRCEAHQRRREQLSWVVAEQPSNECLELIGRTADICERLKLSTIDPDRLAEELQDRRKFLQTAHSISAVLRPLVESRPESRNWQLRDVAKAHGLLTEAGWDAVVSRNGRTSDPDAAHLLQHLCREGRQLQARRAELAGKVSFAVELSVEILADCVSTIRVAGAFRICSPRYRKAKRVFLSVARTRKYNKEEAIDTLEALIAFRRQEIEFNSHPHASAAFGIKFKGIHTEFDPFERLATFYRGVDDHFGKPDKRTLRTFLREADIGELQLLPAIPATEVIITYDSLQERIEGAEAEARVLQAAIADLGTCVHVFADPKSLDPSDLRGIMGVARSVIDEQAALDECAEARGIFGGAFDGSRTSIEPLKAVVHWAAAAAEPYGQLLSTILAANRTGEVRSRVAEVLQAESTAQEILVRLAEVAKIDSRHFTDKRSLCEIAQELDRAAQDADGLFNHAVFATVLDESPKELGPLVNEKLRAGESLDGLGEQFEAVAVRQMAKAVYAGMGSELTKYRGSKLDELRALLAEQDREIIRLSRRQLRTKLSASARPPQGNGIGRKSTWTELALIENEITKKQRFIAVRDLTQRAGRALLELKPCWMMSPLAVAQYVPKGSLHFDLCIIDEASQMPPESAIGALLRCGQTVVVGDTNQLPPSSFFKTLINDEETDEDETVLNESILEMANATFRPGRRLRWHYRSQHSGLIKFSNRIVYDDDLIVFPSATESMTRMGIEFRGVAGRYKAGTNPVEAKAIVEAAFEFMRTDQNRSLGIVTLNQKQRDLISEEFEYAVGNHQHAVKYIESWKERNDGLEEFFIKNLENVQGDERDVIFIGTVYGPEEPGARVMQRFGPINGLAGRRRLNVLFTRAKQKIVTFSSMTASDITADEHSNAGAYMLRRWLEYSASGMLESGERTKREPDSDFEMFVMSQIQSMGYEAVPQIGVAGYFIDIGVRHADWQYGFVLGVECDGASYHSAKSARDRDRLRQEVLQHLGWKLHRIWSTDWFNNSRREAERLRDVIVARLQELKERESEYAAPAPRQLEKGEPIEVREATVALPLFKQEKLVAQEASEQGRRTVNAVGIAVGDTVRVRYLTGDQKTLQVTISRTKSDPAQGIVYYETPVAKALLGAEEGDEVEVLVGSYVRPAIVERITRPVAHPI
jgi:transcription elongation GreA/GreB family factor